MKIVKLEKQIVAQYVTKDILCNNCGLSCSNEKRKNPKAEANEYSGLIEAEVHGGYYSEALGDMVSIKFSICEHCLLKITESFKIPVEKKSHDVSGEYLPLKEYNKREKKVAKENHLTWVKEALVKYPDLKRKDLMKKSAKELYDLVNKSK